MLGALIVQGHGGIRDDILFPVARHERAAPGGLPPAHGAELRQRVVATIAGGTRHGDDLGVGVGGEAGGVVGDLAGGELELEAGHCSQPYRRPTLASLWLTRPSSSQTRSAAWPG